MPTSGSNFTRTSAVAIVNGVSQGGIIGGNVVKCLAFVSIYTIHRQEISRQNKICTESICAFGITRFGKNILKYAGFQYANVIAAV